MASMKPLQLLLAFLSLLLVITTNNVALAREIPMKLQNDGRGESNCWTALADIRSCSNEIIGFFLNGQADIDKPCCLAIATIAQHCWPALIGSLGYSPEEVSFLEGYCEKAEVATTGLSPDGSPVPAYVLP